MGGPLPRRSPSSRREVRAFHQRTALGFKRRRIEQRLQADAIGPCNEMGGADEIAEQAVAVETTREERDAAAETRRAPVPVAARRGVEPRPQETPVLLKVFTPVGFPEEAEEAIVVRQVCRARELQAHQCYMGGVEVQRRHLDRRRRDIGERITAARRDGDDARLRLHAGFERHRLDIDLRVLPYLRIDEPCEEPGEYPFGEPLARDRLVPMDRRADAVGSDIAPSGGGHIVFYKGAMVVSGCGFGQGHTPFAERGPSRPRRGARLVCCYSHCVKPV